MVGSVRGSIVGLVRGSMEDTVRASMVGSVRGSIEGLARVDGGIGERVDGGISERVNGGIDERVNGRIDERIGEGINGSVNGGIDGMAGNEAVRCLCASRVEEEEMVCCDVCQRWSHLRCIGMKEGVGVMEGREFVCHFCLSACLLGLRKEVRKLEKELHNTKSEVKGLREENGKLKEHIEHDRSREVRVAQKEVVKNMTRSEIVVGDEDMPEQGVNNKKSDEKKAPK